MLLWRSCLSVFLRSASYVDWGDILRKVTILGFYAGVVGVVAFARMVWVICLRDGGG
jgi:hypothetical protein